MPPWAANVKKRIVKSPRVYLRDTGLLHRLLRLNDPDDLAGHPARGVSWEGYVLEQIAAAAPDAELSFYRTSAGAELDLVVRRGNPDRLSATPARYRRGRVTGSEIGSCLAKHAMFRRVSLAEAVF